MRTRVIALAASKGGVGKTTLSAALSVRAAIEHKRVALIDADRQASLERWWELRGEPSNPKLLELEASREGIELAIAEGWQWVFIDSPPGLIDTIEPAIAAADFVIIPCRASAIDLEAMDQVVEICTNHGKPFSFVLNAIEPGTKLTQSAASMLSRQGPVFEAKISYRRPYITAMTHGKSGPEVERGSACETEIEALWRELGKTLEKAGL